MKRCSKQFVVAMAFAAAAFSGSIAGLSDDDRDRTHGSKASAKGGLTVNRGTATGNRDPGNQVTVRADPAPAGAQFAHWTGDVAALADRFSSTTTAIVPFTAATVTATFTPVTASNSVPEHVGGGDVLPATAKPKGYSLTDIAKATAFFATTAPNDRSKETEPDVPFQILYTTSDPSNTFSVRPGTMLYVPIFFADDSEPIPLGFPNDVTDPAKVEDFYFSDAKLGAKFLEITVDGKTTSIERGSGYIVGVEVARLADGGGTHYIPTAVFLTPLTKGTHTVTIRARFEGAAVGFPPPFEFEIPYTVIVN